MKRAQRNRYGKRALELIEEATHLLRAAPAGVLAVYYVGTVPFVLGWMFFWADMSSGAFAAQHLVGGALTMALLFLWMKWWHVFFARNLRAFLAGDAAPRWGFAQCRRVFVAQTILQPFGLFILPVSLLLTVPFGWAYAFFQNLTVLDDGETTRIRELAGKARRQATLWAGQNHVILIVMGLFGIVVWLSWIMVGFLVPMLAKSLLGIESAFTRSGNNLLNTTFIAAVFGLTYLSLDPIIKAIYVLRGFYGESITSGEDLKVELKRFAAQPGLVSVLIALLMFGATALPAQDATPAPLPAPTPTAPTTSVEPQELDRTINDVIRKNKYAWRSPREKVVEGEEKQTGPIGQFFKDVLKKIAEMLKGVLEWLGRVLQKIFGRSRAPSSNGFNFDFMLIPKLLLALLVVAVGGALFFFLFRVWRNRQRPVEVVQTEAILPVPDVADENVSAEQLPEDGWTKLGRELLERGEWRLALRAFYLASLAHLAQRNLISLAKFKSNRDYERELQRRGHSFPNLLTLFGENILLFDRTWYGRHEANRELVQHFATNVDKIKVGG